MKKTDILKYCKYYHGEKKNPYKDFEKMYLWQAERMSITDNENKRKNTTNFFLKNCYNTEKPDNIPLVLRAYIFCTQVHISEKYAYNMNYDDIISSAFDKYWNIILRYNAK